MSINDTHILPPAVPVSLDNFGGADRYPEEAGCTELGRLTQSAAFSSVVPRLRTAFDLTDGQKKQDADPSGHILDMLAGNITLLQDSFMDSLYEKLQNMGVDLSQKLTLRLDDEARLRIAGEHPDEAAINTLLACDPELTTAFMEIAAQSAALRDLRSLRTLTLYDRAADGYSALAAGPGECIYQLSLKGEMNHFYFTR